MVETGYGWTMFRVQPQLIPSFSGPTTTGPGEPWEPVMVGPEQRQEPVMLPETFKIPVPGRIDISKFRFLASASGVGSNHNPRPRLLLLWLEPVMVGQCFGSNHYRFLGFRVQP